MRQGLILTVWVSWVFVCFSWMSVWFGCTTCVPTPSINMVLLHQKHFICWTLQTLVFLYVLCMASEYNITGLVRLADVDGSNNKITKKSLKNKLQIVIVLVICTSQARNMRTTQYTLWHSGYRGWYGMWLCNYVNTHCAQTTSSCNHLCHFWLA
jgi:hypothetical protein